MFLDCMGGAPYNSHIIRAQKPYFYISPSSLKQPSGASGFVGILAKYRPSCINYSETTPTGISEEL